MKGTNHKNMNHVQYLCVPSDIKLILRSPDILIPDPSGNMEYIPDSEHCDTTLVAGDDT